MQHHALNNGVVGDVQREGARARVFPRAHLVRAMAERTIRRVGILVGQQPTVDPGREGLYLLRVAFATFGLGEGPIEVVVLWGRIGVAVDAMDPAVH